MINLILKGFIIGIGKIMPGVSGAMLAMSLGIYEKAIESISHFLKNPIKNFKYLICLFIGAFLAIVFMSKIIIYFLNHYYLSTMLLFIGLIIGGFPNFVKKMEIKKAKLLHYMIMIFSLILVLILEFHNKENVIVYESNFKSYFFIGFVDAATMIIPGLCGTSIMMLLGCYDLLLNLMANLSNLNGIISHVNLLVPYALGAVITILVLSKLISYLFNNKSTFIYFAIFGFSVSSVLVLFLSTFERNYNFWEIVISLILLFIGCYFGNKFDK